MDGSIVRRHGTTWAALAAVAMGVVSYVSAERHLGARERESAARLAQRYAEIEIVVAARDLAAGTRVDANTLAIRRVPARFAPRASLSPTRIEPLLRGTLRVAVQAGDALQSSFVDVEDSRTLADRIEPGQRALTIAVDDVNSFSGLLRPGDRIDLLLAGESSAAATTVRSLLENVVVLATGRALQSGEVGGGEERRDVTRSFSTVTVAVTPLDAERIALAQRLGGLATLLRHRSDDRSLLRGVLTAHSLFGDRVPRPRPPAVPREFVELIVGGLGAQGVTRVAAHAY